MKESSSVNVCRHSAKRIKSLLGKSKNVLLSFPPFASEAFLHKGHKCDQVKLPQIVLQMDRLCHPKPQIQKHLLKRREMHLPHTTLTRMHQEVLMTQCSVNQKYMHCCVHQEMRNPVLLHQRVIQQGFREYFFAYKQFKSLSNHPIFHAKKHQIALLEDEKEQWPKDFLPIKQEERHFRMGHTIKHPS